MATIVQGAGPILIHVGRERPTWDLWWMDDDGDPIDLSSGYTFTVQVRQTADTTITATVTANATPSATVPTLNVAPASGQLDALVTGPATIIVVATTGGLDREGHWPAVVDT